MVALTVNSITVPIMYLCMVQICIGAKFQSMPHNTHIILTSHVARSKVIRKYVT